MTDDKTVYEKEQESKAKAVQQSHRIGEEIRSADLDNAPPGQQMPNQPVPNAQYGPNYIAGPFAVTCMAADGHHGPERWDVSRNNPGTTSKPQHEHDDYKRPANTTPDAGLDPKQFRIGFFAQYRVPDSRDALSQPGDKLGLTPEQRAAIKKQNEP